MNLDKAKLIEIFKNYPQIITNRLKFVSLLKDYFPTQKLHCNAFIMVYDLDIIKEIEKNEINDLFINKYIKKMMNEYGMQIQLAKASVLLWCEVFGKEILHKDIVYQSSEENKLIIKKQRVVKETTTLVKNTNYDTVDVKNIFAYYDYGWEFHRALFDFFPEIKRYITQSKCYSVYTIFEKFVKFDTRKALEYWRWLLVNFPESEVKKKRTSKEDGYHTISVYCISCFTNAKDKKLVYNFIKDEFVYNCLMFSNAWLSGEYYDIEHLMQFAIDCGDDKFAVKIYSDYFMYQNKLKICEKVEFLSDIWNDLIDCDYLKHKELTSFVLAELLKMGKAGITEHQSIVEEINDSYGIKVT